MPKKNELIDQITKEEYQMMNAVQGIGGRASCQDDEVFFRKMRRCQFMPWEEAVLESYLADLIQAKNMGRNMVSEKYGFMMERTDPANYQKIAHLLPLVNEAKMADIAEICRIAGNWQKELISRFPKICSQGRSYDNDAESNIGGTSFMTYLSSELKTYSPETISLYKEMLRKMLEDGRNLNLESMKETVKSYGYTSIEEAESKM